MDPPPTVQQLPRRFLRIDVVSFAALLVAGLLIYGWVGLYSATAVTFSDSMDYVMIADFYRAIFRGETPSPETIFHYRLTRFPPLFPMLLGGLGAGSEHQHLASLISLTFSFAAPLMVWAWIRRETGSSGKATVIAAALMLYPAYFLLSLSPVSEPFAIFLYALALYLTAGRAPHSSAWAVAALLVGVALLARTALLPLAIALVLVAVVQRTAWRRCGFLAILSFGPLLAWAIYRRSLGAAGYSSFITREALIAELGGWPDALWVQPWRLLVAADSNWGPTIDSVAWIITLIIAALVVVGVAVRMRRWALDAWFLAGYVAMILVWPYPFELGRFLVVVYPICLLAAMEGVQWLLAVLKRFEPSGRPWLAILLLVAVASGPTVVKFALRATVPVDPSLLDEKREQFFFEPPLDATAIENAEVVARARLLARQIPDHVPVGECIYATMPQFVALHGKRDSASYPRDIKSEDVAREKLTQCRFFFIADIDMATNGTPAMYPAAFVKSWTILRMVSNVEGKGTAAALLEVSESKKSQVPVQAEGKLPD